MNNDYVVQGFKWLPILVRFCSHGLLFPLSWKTETNNYFFPLKGVPGVNGVNGVNGALF